MVKLRPGNIIFDMDEVLFNISPYMYKKIRLHWNEFFPYLKDLGPLSDKEILERDKFMIIDWLMKDLPVQEDLQKILKNSTNKIINNICFTSNMYERINPTKLCKNSLLNPQFMNDSAIKSCTILTRTADIEDMRIAKEKIFKKYFNNPKIKIEIIQPGEKKSDALKRLGIDWSLVIDDEVKNIKDIAENFDLERREFLLPKFGYNQMPPEVALLIKEKGGTLTYYDSF